MDGVIFENVRGYNMIYAIEFYLWYACDANKKECGTISGKDTIPVVSHNTS